MTTVFDLFLSPFTEFAFMQRALLGSVLLAISCAPLGLFLIQRRMSLVGDAVAHGVLPGVAIGFIIAGFSVPAMSIGGLIAGMIVASASAIISRITPQREDTTLAVFYLSALAPGVMLVSAQGAKLDLMHILFGSVLAIDGPTLGILVGTAGLSCTVMMVIFRPLVLETLDPGFSKASGRAGGIAQTVFLILVVANLVAAFQALGTLMGVGLLILPAAAARFWARELKPLILIAAGFGSIAVITGLILSYHVAVPSGPAIVSTASGTWLISLLLGPRAGLLRRHQSF